MRQKIGFMHKRRSCAGVWEFRGFAPFCFAEFPQDIFTTENAIGSSRSMKA